MSGCNWQINDPVRPARAGTVTSVSGALVKIKHHYRNSQGFNCRWETWYMHLRGIMVKKGDSVATSTDLGYPPCKGGRATGVHLHFLVAWDGALQPIAGHQLSGWLIGATSCYDGTMKKGNVTLIADARRPSSNRVNR